MHRLVKFTIQKTALILLVATLALTLAACGATEQPPAPTSTVAPTVFPTPDPGPGTENPFTSILGTVAAPPGWAVFPCEGGGPFLCVSDGEQFLGSVELLVYPLDDHVDAQQMRDAAGLEAGQPLDLDDPEQVRAAREVLHAVRADHMGAIEDDREITYPEDRTFTLIEPEAVQVGALPGLFYGFAGVEANGETYERWLTYVGFDGENLYFLTAFYDPSDTPGTFPSDEALQQFAPYLREIVAGLNLPLKPVP